MSLARLRAFFRWQDFAVVATAAATLQAAGCSSGDGPDQGSSGAPNESGGSSGDGGAPTGGRAGGTGGQGLGGQGGEGTGGDGCSVIGPEVQAHVDLMATEGWAARNVENEMAMYGCVGDEGTRDCLSEKPSADDTVYGADWTSDLNGSVLRVLRVNSARSSFLTRSSPDGRFVASGITPGDAQVIDLQRDFLVPTAGMYEPSFFPDGFGWIMQGGPNNVCAQSVLTSNPSEVTLLESGCSNIGAIGLNQSVGASLDGNYWAIDGEFEADNGGQTPTVSDPGSSASASAYLDATPLIFDGEEFMAGAAPPRLDLPYEGNLALSPSGRLVLSRLGSADDELQHGYVLRTLGLNEAETALESTQLAHYCVNGSDAVFSYDERWVVFHHYVEPSDAEELGFDGPNDPAFADYLTQGSANVFLLDLASGSRTRVTRMNPGQYALYPHFRSDGWIYFVVRTLETTTEYLVASDAALSGE